MRAPSKAYVREIQVGLFVLLACMIIAAFSLKITSSPIFRRGTALTVYLNDATGIFIDSKVKMAGIDIGGITRIQLDNGRAKISILIDKGVQIPPNAQIVPRPLGILGDKYLEMVVPKDPKAPVTDTQSRIFWPFKLLISEAHAEEVAEAEGTSPKLRARTTKQGEVVIKGVDASVTLDDLTRQMGKVSEDLKDISSNLKKLIRDNQNEITQMIHSMNRITQKIEKSISGFDEKQLQSDLKRLSESVGSINNTLKNAESITAKIDRGEGTLGKLVNDPSTANELNRTLSTINAVVEKARRTLTIVDMTAEYGFKSKLSKTYIGLTIQPREDTAYIGQVVIDPAGVRKKKVVTRTPLGGTPYTEEVVTDDRSKLKYSLQFMKRISNLSLRLGLFENTGGFGSDLYFLHDTLKFTAEAFDWSREDNNAHLKLSAQLRILNYFYLSVGGDDLISKSQDKYQRSSVFAGVGLRFTDEDLKTLLTLQSIP